jgi:hypothetical protein
MRRGEIRLNFRAGRENYFISVMTLSGAESFFAFIGDDQDCRSQHCGEHHFVFRNKNAAALS